MGYPALLNVIGSVRIGDISLPVARFFVFDADPDTSEPGFAAVYISHNGEATLHSIAPLVSFTRSRKPRREPHVAVVSTPGGDVEWTALLAGCGCGNPVKRINESRALGDQSKGVTPLVPLVPA